MVQTNVTIGCFRKLRLSISIVSNSGFYESAGLFYYQQGLFNVWWFYRLWEISTDKSGHISGAFLWLFARSRHTVQDSMCLCISFYYTKGKHLIDYRNYYVL